MQLLGTCCATGQDILELSNAVNVSSLLDRTPQTDTNLARGSIKNKAGSCFNRVSSRHYCERFRQDSGVEGTGAALQDDSVI